MPEIGFSKEYKTHYTTDVIPANENHEILLAGWISAIRDKGKIIFLRVRDSRGSCQIVVKEDAAEDLRTKAKQLTAESVVSIRGKVIKDSRSATGAELVPLELTIHRIADKLPVDLGGKKVATDLDTLMKHRHITIRREDAVMIFRIKSAVAKAVREFYYNNGFFEIWSPLVLGTATEGGAAMFKVQYYDTPAVLAQSAQFYKQAAIAVHEKVFGIIPSWRAEKSRTTKHLSEFHQIETEIAFGTDQTIMELQENLLVYVATKMNERCAEELKGLGRTLKTPKLPLKRIPFKEAKELAIKLLKEKGEEEPEGDISTSGEMALSEYYKDPFFITEFPKAIRGIYYETDPNDDDITRSLDLIADEGFCELSSGGVRVADPDRLLSRINNAGYNPENFTWYLEMFKFGMPPHAGFGLGFERLVRWVTGAKNIKEVIMFPRTPDILNP